MSSNQLSHIISEIDRVLGLSSSSTMPAELILAQQREVLISFKNYLNSNNQALQPQLTEQIKSLINRQIEQKKQYIEQLTQEIEELDQVLSHVFALETPTQITEIPQRQTSQLNSPLISPEVFEPPSTSESVPIILQENIFKPWEESTTEQASRENLHTISALTDLLPSTIFSSADLSNAKWYLGLDFATTGISAVLLNQVNHEQYPFYWLDLQSQAEIFRLPLKAKISDSSVLIAFGADPSTSDRGLLLEKFKPWLKEAIAPYNLEQSPQLQPKFNYLNIYFTHILQIIQKILESLKSSQTMVLDLSSEQLKIALESLQGIIVSCPFNWGDTYRFNLREIILQSGLIQEPGKIFFIEEAIASLVSRCPAAPTVISDNPTFLLINLGESTTELAVVTLPENPENLTYKDFTLQSLDYGGEAFEQDILVNLVYPHFSYLSPAVLDGNINLPEIGEINPAKRNHLKLILQAQPLGHSLLDIAKQLQIILQQENKFSCKLGGNYWEVKRQDLDLKITLPFVKQLEQQIEIILTTAGKDPENISQIICTGGLYPSVSRVLSALLKKKFTQATFIDDSQEESQLAVAIGLSRLPLFPKILDTVRHQYNDYFLLSELLESLPKEKFNFEEILKRLSWRGINSRVCAERIFSFLHNNLPLGLESGKNRVFSNGIFPLSLTLFTEENGYYLPNTYSCEILREFLKQILAHSKQSLREPLIADFSALN